MVRTVASPQECVADPVLVDLVLVAAAAADAAADSRAVQNTNDGQSAAVDAVLRSAGNAGSVGWVGVSDWSRCDDGRGQAPARPLAQAVGRDRLGALQSGAWRPGGAAGRR